MDEEELTFRLRNDHYPRSGRFPGRWMVENAMGPNPVWLAEALTEVMPLAPNMRILDMGCGKAISSIFLAKEFGVEVWAADLWVPPDENWRRIEREGLQGKVHPVHVEAHSLPFAEAFFDALISVDAYHYFGTDDLYIGYYSRFVRPGGGIGFVVPGLAYESDELPPDRLAAYWKWDFCSFHSPGWWRRHLEKTGLVTVEVADRLPDGWRDWLQWNEVCDADRGQPGDEAAMLRTDAGQLLGFARVAARRPG
ncbi:MAG: SAM-dependent methyltransferase [Mycobacteriales bacterium]